MKIENIENFINYNYKSVSNAKIIKRIILFWLFTLPLGYFGIHRELFTVLFVALNIVYTIISVSLIARKTYIQEKSFLADGFMALYLSFTMMIASYKFAALSTNENIWILILLFSLLIINLSIFPIMIYFNIKNNRYTNNVENNNISNSVRFGSILGIGLAPLLAPVLSQEHVPIFISVILAMFSLLMSIGSFNLLKYYLLKKTKEISGQSQGDWRLARGQIKYLYGEKLFHHDYVPYNESCDHDHCEFCTEKFSNNDGDLHIGYSTKDNRIWICEECFNYFKDIFKWNV